MPELQSPTCARDLRGTPNCLDSVTAKPGGEIRVIVRVKDQSTIGKLMEAIGALSHDGKSFSVVVTREDSAQQTFS